jgi:ribonuclease HIII
MAAIPVNTHPSGAVASSSAPSARLDEWGKGDYFGPLVSAAVFADTDCAERLTAIRVQDCKQLSDERVRRLAPQVRATVGRRGYKLTQLTPERYNTLYARFSAQGRNLNHMLAGAHARSIEDLLLMGARPTEIVVDQLADVHQIEHRLLQQTRASGAELLQFPGAESEVTVAAASILAREAFVEWLAWASARLGTILPEGASPRVEEVARQIAIKGGRDALSRLVKLHFSTTAKVQR